MEELGAVLETGGAAAVEIAASALAERGAPSLHCPNCGKPLVGPYCAICGQPLNTHRRSVKHLVHELVTDIASFDSRILRTARALLIKPGELPKAFKDGRTQPYVPAVRLYLFVSLLFFLFLSATGIAFIQLGLQVNSVKFVHDSAGHVIKIADGKRTIVEGLKSDAVGNVTAANPDADIPVPNMKADGDATNTITTRAEFFSRIGHSKVQAAQNLKPVMEEVRKETKQAGWFMRGVYSTLEKLQSDPAALNGPLTAWIPRILFVLLPLFAVLLALFYRKQRKEFLFVDHLVFSLTMHSFAFVVLIGAAIAAQVLSSGWVASLTIIVLSLYFLLSLKHFYGQGWVKTGLKFAGVAFIYPVFFLGPALAFAIVASVVEG